MKVSSLFSIALAFAITMSCAKVPVTKRKQLKLLPEKNLIDMSKTSYVQFLAESKVLPDNDARSQRVKEVGNKIKDAAISFLTKHNQLKRIENFEWQFNTVNDPTVNAWCMPGGFVVVYTGILELVETDDELATIMGHEIAHAIARHGNERMSQGLGVQVALGVLQGTTSEDNQNLLYYAGVGSQLGILKFSRMHESESDKIGLVYMKMAGYDPNHAVTFWQKMAANGGSVPELLSTHPSDEKRIKDIQEFIPKIDEILK
ncbi:MAG: M48 family metallopeptidase [Crocinitomicaceae bacterium]|jgi:predicted Zn-dependent protease|nr:M48 family metallopeptidase [Crocinitomicaceae bacterium]